MNEPEQVPPEYAPTRFAPFRFRCRGVDVIEQGDGGVVAPRWAIALFEVLGDRYTVETLDLVEKLFAERRRLPIEQANAITAGLNVEEARIIHALSGDEGLHAWIAERCAGV